MNLSRALNILVYALAFVGFSSVGCWSGSDEGGTVFPTEDARTDGSSGGPSVSGNDTGGGSNTRCPDGYEPDGVQCSDIDECQRGTNDCAEGQICKNTDGGYQCSGGPKLSQLHVSPDQLTPKSGPLTISVKVGDPDGGGDIAGGKLMDPQSENRYGTFVIGHGAGRYQIELTFDQIHSVRSIQTTAGGTKRSFAIVFQDVDGNLSRQTIDVKLQCSDLSKGLCGVNCYNFESSDSHCGGCNNTCDGAEGHCESGVCEACYSGKTPCGAQCVDLQTNETHCGECYNELPDDEFRCRGGEATCTDRDETPWNGMNYDSCADLSYNEDNCGSCGRSCNDWWSRRSGGISLEGDDYINCRGGNCMVKVTVDQRQSCSTICGQWGLSCTMEYESRCEDEETQICAAYDSYSFSVVGYGELSCSDKPPEEHPTSNDAGDFVNVRCYCK